MNQYEYPKLFVGPVSKSVVDIVCLYDINLGLIPSRRQIEFTGGYVNNWDTNEFCSYVRRKNSSIIIERDHGGPEQGIVSDDGTSSFYHDCKNNFSIIHIDPWLKYKNLDQGIEYTVDMIKKCLSNNSDVKFEVGTEEAILKYSSKELEYLLKKLKTELGDDYNKIVYAVIQSGTSISGIKNTGVFDEDRFKRMIEICKRCGVMSKEHNGDYLCAENIKYKFNLGLDSINIAPEFGYIETRTIIDRLIQNFDEELYLKLYERCFNSRRWCKWLPDTLLNREIKNQLIMLTSGHYVFSSDTVKEIKTKYTSLQNEIDNNIKTKLDSILK